MCERKTVQNILYELEKFKNWLDKQYLTHDLDGWEIEAKVQPLFDAFDEVDEDLMARFGLFIEGEEPKDWHYEKGEVPHRPL